MIDSPLYSFCIQLDIGKRRFDAVGNGDYKSLFLLLHNIQGILLMLHLILQHIHSPDIFSKEPLLRLRNSCIYSSLCYLFRIFGKPVEGPYHSVISKKNNQDNSKIRDEENYPCHLYRKDPIIGTIYKI